MFPRCSQLFLTRLSYDRAGNNEPLLRNLLLLVRTLPYQTNPKNKNKIIRASSTLQRLNFIRSLDIVEINIIINQFYFREKKTSYSLAQLNADLQEGRDIYTIELLIEFYIYPYYRIRIGSLI